jgi:hypothetical protein
MVPRAGGVTKRTPASPTSRRAQALGQLVGDVVSDLGWQIGIGHQSDRDHALLHGVRAAATLRRTHARGPRPRAVSVNRN